MATPARPIIKKSARKTPAKRAVARRTAVDNAEKTAGAVATRAEDALATAVKLARDVAHTYLGAGLVVQDRIARRDFSTSIGYSEFLDQAKSKGHERVLEIQDFVEPYVKRVVERIEPITNRIESNLPKPVKDVLDTSMDRVRELLAA